MCIRSNKTILVAEDHKDGREFLQVLLESEGFRAVTAKDGLEAVRIAREEIPDLILTDLHMPNLDGIGAAMQIRGTPELNAVPILAISADGMRGIELFHKVGEMGTGFIYYLTKPLNMDEIIELVNRLLPAAVIA